MIWCGRKVPWLRFLIEKNVELMGFYSDLMVFLWDINETYRCHWIGLRENLEEKKHIFWEKTRFPVDFP